MISKGIRVTAEQGRWADTVRNFGCVCTGADIGEYGGIQIHHVVGLSGKQDKVLIGPWYILPLHYRLHDPRDSYELNITNNRAIFLKEYGPEKQLFLKMIDDLLEGGVLLPFDDSVLSAIKNSHR